MNTRSEKVVLITGDSGFIGSYLAAHLVRSGYRVRGLDRVSKIMFETDYPQVIGDILDRKVLTEAMRDVDCIIHLAAKHGDFGVTDQEYFDVNEIGTRELLGCARDCGIKQFIFFSSVAVYGNQQSPSEEAAVHPSNPYGLSKRAAEGAVRDWASEDPDRMCVIIRPTVVFGPHNRANIFKLIKYVCDKKFIWVGDGDIVKSLAYVENLVEATHFLLKRMNPGLQVINYVDEPQMTTRQVVDLIARNAGVAVPKLKIPLGVAVGAARMIEMFGSITGHDFPVTATRLKKFNTSTCYSSGKIRSLGFKAPYSLEFGIAKNVQWYLQEVQAKRSRVYENWEQ